MPIPERLNPTFSPTAPRRPDPLVEARRRLVVALDRPDAVSAARLVAQLEGNCQWFKWVWSSLSPPVPHSWNRSSGAATPSSSTSSSTTSQYRSRCRALHRRARHTHGQRPRIRGPAMLAAAKDALEGIPDPPNSSPSPCSRAWIRPN